MWERSHRPRQLAEMALGPETRRTLETCLAKGCMPDLLLVGPPGFGKSTVASILEDALAFQVDVINASGSRGIDVVRERIAEGMRMSAGPGSLPRQLSSNPEAPYRVFRLEEAEGMTVDALRALRTVIDQKPEWVRFIFTGNKCPRDEAIVDRCHVVQLKDIPVEEMAAVVERILVKEGKEADRNTVLCCAEAAPSMRWLIQYVERCFNELDRLEAPDPDAAATAHGVAHGTSSKEGVELLLAVHRVVADSGKSRLRTRDILIRLVESGWPQYASLSMQVMQELGRRLKPFDVRSKTFTDPGAKSARGYRLTALTAAVERLRLR